MRKIAKNLTPILLHVTDFADIFAKVMHVNTEVEHSLRRSFALFCKIVASYSYEKDVFSAKMISMSFR